MHKFPVKGKKGILKGGGPKPIEHEKYRAVLDQLLPLLARRIDASGGVMRVADLAGHKDVKTYLSQVPPRCPKTLPLILSQWTDFFVNMSDGLVGTALGYDTGMIKEDGTLNPLYESNFAPEGDLIDVEEPEVVQLSEAKPMDLTEAADIVWQASLNLVNDAELKAAFKLLENARKALKEAPKPVQNPPRSGKKPGKKPAALNIGESERAHRKMRILYRIVEILERSPGQTKNMCLILSDPTIRELKKGVVSKFLSFLQEFPKMMKITQVEGIPQYSVTLLDNHVPDLKASKKGTAATKGTGTGVIKGTSTGSTEGTGTAVNQGTGTASTEGTGAPKGTSTGPTKGTGTGATKGTGTGVIKGKGKQKGWKSWNSWWK